jgi:hypothetical protein
MCCEGVAVAGDAVYCPSLMVILLGQGLWGCPGKVYAMSRKDCLQPLFGEVVDTGDSESYIEGVNARINPVCWC